MGLPNTEGRGRARGLLGAKLKGWALFPSKGGEARAVPAPPPCFPRRTVAGAPQLCPRSLSAFAKSQGHEQRWPLCTLKASEKGIPHINLNQSQRQRISPALRGTQLCSLGEQKADGSLMSHGGDLGALSSTPKVSRDWGEAVNSVISECAEGDIVQMIPNRTGVLE